MADLLMVPSLTAVARDIFEVTMIEHQRLGEDEYAIFETKLGIN